MNNEILLFVDKNGWQAEYHGNDPFVKEMIVLFGTHTLPTGFTNKTDAATVVKKITELNPGFNVKLKYDTSAENTLKEASEILNCTHRYVWRLIKNKKIKATRPIDKTTKPYYVTLDALQDYLQRRDKAPRKLKRCEPCAHLKRTCLHCKKMMCLNDFPTQDSLKNTKRPYCKDCENKTRQRYRTKTRARVPSRA
jgi:excisionase family DNA binding protein